MTEFIYKAINPSGSISQGTVVGDNEGDVITTLQQQGLSPLSIKAKNHFSLNQLWKARKSVGSNHIVLFTQQLATMLNAGLTIERALQLLTDLTRHKQLKAHQVAILAQVRDGVDLSTALESRSGLVSKLYISMVRAGENGGALATTLQSLSEYLSRAQDLQRGLVSALIYPLILLIMAVLSVIALLTFVVPSFAPMFEELGDDMPTITQVVLGGGAFLQQYWWLLIALVIFCIMAGQQWLAKSDNRQRFHRWLLGLSKVGDLIAKMETARFTRTLGSLLTNGVPILRALPLAAEVVNNTAFISDLKIVTNEVKTGRSLSEAMSDLVYFPDMAQQMLIVGQETGHLESILLKIADTYDKEVKVTTDRLLSILVPVMILVLSVVIATIVISILLAILSVNDLFG
ncbi:MAG: general secretion pathway protein F [Candidatus Endobugula sp.]|jgi:general secretion pathway protein F